MSELVSAEVAAWKKKGHPAVFIPFRVCLEYEKNSGNVSVGVCR